MDEITECDLENRPFTLKTMGMVKTIKTKALIIATGASARYLGLENETRLQGYGICSCDLYGFFYQGVEIVAVGGGDSELEESWHSYQVC